MKIKLRGGFTDIVIDGKFETSPFVPGDEVDVLEIVQTCPDKGCCEMEFVVQTPLWNDGKPFSAHKYYDKAEVDLEKFDALWDSDGLFTTYKPKKQ